MSIEENDEVNVDINDALDKIYLYAGAEAEIVETLGLKQSLKDLLEKAIT